MLLHVSARRIRETHSGDTARLIAAKIGRPAAEWSDLISSSHTRNVSEAHQKSLPVINIVKIWCWKICHTDFVSASDFAAAHAGALPHLLAWVVSSLCLHANLGHGPDLEFWLKSSPFPPANLCTTTTLWRDIKVWKQDPGGCVQLRWSLSSPNPLKDVCNESSPAGFGSCRTCWADAYD